MSSLNKRSRKIAVLILSALLLLPLINLSTPASRAMLDHTAHYLSVWAQKNVFVPISNPGDSMGAWSGDNSASNWVDGDPSTNKMARPKAVGDIIQVYSADQLRYALEKFVEGHKIKIMRDIDFGGVHSWTPVVIGKRTLDLDGGGKTLYNLYSRPTSIVTTYYTDAGFVTELKGYSNQWLYHKIRNFTFKNIKCESPILPGAASPFIGFERGEIMNVGVEDGLMHTQDRWAYGFAFLQRNMVFSNDYSGPVSIRNCYTKNVTTLAEGKRTSNPKEYACTCSFVGGGVNKYNAIDSKGTDVKGALIKNCYAIGNTVISLKGHSGGFSTCTYGMMTIEECFSDVTVLGGDLSGAFQGPLHDGKFWFNDCCALGSVDGDNVVGGFAAGFELINDDNWRFYQGNPFNNQQAEFKRCYSAAIVGMQENGTCIGSFMGAPLFVTTPGKHDYRQGTLDGLYFTDCYAVGETGGIGSITRDANISGSVGGFMGRDYFSGGGAYFPVGGNMVFSRCYYDKQTTAARTWATGTKREYSTSYGAIDIKGVLTTTTSKSGFGLAEGTPTSTTWSSRGFTGFSNDGNWLYKKGYYPQLRVFSDANSSSWGDKAELVKAYSEASASTVFLRTWDTLPVETYDTVRDLTLRFPLTSASGIRWDKIPDPYGIGGLNAIDLEYSMGTWHGVNLSPGITWVEVTATRNAGQYSEVKGKRRLRLIPIASLEAGEDMTWTVGDKHAHYEQVELRYSDPWSIYNGVPITSHGYPIPPHVTKHYFTDADASRTAPGSKISVKGTPINAATVNPVTYQVNVGLANLPFNDRANEPDPDGWRDVFSREAVIQNKHGGIFLLDYKWTLPDGRYLQDYKQVTINKRAKATLEVRDQNDTLVGGAMYLNLVRQPFASFAFDASGGLVSQRTEAPVPAGTAMIFAWKPDSASVNVDRLSVTIGSQNTILTNPQVGNTFTQNVTGYKDLRLVNDEYFYMTIVNGQITRTLQQKDGAMVIGLVGTQTIDGVAFPDFEDDVTVIVYIQGDSFVTLNIRQQVLGTRPANLKLPGAGIYRLHNIKFGQPGVYDPAAALPIASGSSVPTDPIILKAFTEYKLPLPSDKKAYRIEPIVPQYYNYAGYNQSLDYEDHDISPYISSPEIIADYTDKDKLWVTVYLRAKPGDPADHTTELQPNEFKLVPGP